MMNQIILKVHSRKLTQLNDVLVLLPQCDYIEGKKYPVLWLLHGGSWDYTAFLYHDRIESLLENKEYIVVAPSGLNSDFADHMEFANGYPMTEYFFDELMPLIYRLFPASEEKKDNYLMGYSMGGAAALMFSLLHPEKFGDTAVMGSTVRESGFLEEYRNLTGYEFRKLSLSDRRRFPTEFGNPEEGITLKEINMISRYDTVSDYLSSPECTIERFKDAVSNNKVPKLMFVLGEEDECCGKIKAFRSYAQSLGVNSIRYVFIPGCSHNQSDVVLKRAVEEIGL